MAKKYDRLLEVQVLHAKDLKNSLWMGHIDPFVAVAPVGLSAPNSNHTHSLTDATEGDYNTTMYFYVNFVSGRSGGRARRLHSSAS